MKTNNKNIKAILVCVTSVILLFEMAACSEIPDEILYSIPYSEKLTSSEASIEYDYQYTSSEVGSNVSTTKAEEDKDDSYNNEYAHSDNHATQENTDNSSGECPSTKKENYASTVDNERSASTTETEVDNASYTETCSYADSGINEKPSQKTEQAEIPDDTNTSSSNEKECAMPSSSVIPNHDYSKDAEIRTNEVLFNVKNPTVGATEATIRTEITNNRNSEVTMVGCTITDALGKTVTTHYVPSTYAEKLGYFELNLGKDLNLVLERNTTYCYKFVVEVDGELFTHKEMSFRTNAVDDRFAFELKETLVAEDAATIATKVFNPTGANVKSVGYEIREAGAVGAQVCKKEFSVDTTDTEFLLQFEESDLRDAFGPDFEYHFFINHEGETYESYTDYFTIPK